MDMVNKDDAELETRNEDALNFQSINMSSDWQLSGSNLTNASMVNSFCASVWNHPTGSSNLGFYNTNIQLNPGTTDALGTVNRMLGTGWTQPNEMLKGATFVSSAANMLPHSLAQFTADSGLIERAARFSCFSGGKVGDTVDSFIIPKSPNTYYNGLQPPSAVSNQKQQMGNAVGNSMDVTLPLEHGVTDRSPFKNEKNEAKECVGISGNESDEAECSDHQEELEGRDSSPRSLGSKKRKRSGQQAELNQMKRAQRPPAEPIKDRAEIQKGVQNLNSTASKPGGKNGKRESQSTEPPKEEYIHIRARRGQATNSHSLAERLRREKISERMKFLQDLVPGCNKVTGKAVMLDEIINYVQSLQRQVEFLSMKLATVNPQLDFNLDGFIAKDILHSRAGPSSSFAFAPDMTMPYPSVHQLQPGLLQSGLPSLGNSTDAFLRSLHPNFAATSGGYKDSSSSQLLNIWDDELHNVVDMGVSTSAPLLNQDLSGGMKAEP